jgi:hypothetical protein
MKGPVDCISLDGTEIRVALKPPLPPDGKALAAGAAVRILERYPAIHRVIAVWGQAQFEVSREHVDRMLRPDGFAALSDRARWQDVVNRLVLDLGR